MYQYILFDLDGTLTDPGLGITNSVAYALKKMGIPVPERSELYKFIGPPLLDSFSQFFGLSREESEQAVTFYREYFRRKGIFENQVYPGIPELLAKLQESGRTLILATSKPEEFALRILEHFGLKTYFSFVAGATMDSSRCAKVDVIRYALENCGITDLSAAVMIGDREYDVIGWRTFSRFWDNAGDGCLDEGTVGKCESYDFIDIIVQFVYNNSEKGGEAYVDHSNRVQKKSEQISFYGRNGRYLYHEEWTYCRKIVQPES